MLMASFYSCRINKNNTEVTNIEFEYLDIMIRNNSDTVYYFNKTDIENPACFVDYIDDKNINNFVHQTSNVWFFIGDKEHFGLNEHGLDNIIYIWKSLITWFLSIHCKDV